MLVNAKINDKGEIEETEKHTGIWAWKHTHGDGTITYTRLAGDIVFEDVTFGYTDEKQFFTTFHSMQNLVRK